MAHRLQRATQTSTSPLPLTPPLKWAGGKRWLVPTLKTYWQQHPQRRLVEPFCGGLAVALGLQPTQALLNDTNAHLINFYTQLQKGLVTRRRFQNESTYYYTARTTFNQMIASGQYHNAQAAAWFYYLNRTGYNGLCRFNRSGLYNVPFGKYKTISYTKDFTPYQAVLSPWQLACGDFEQLAIQKNDWIYADPPYDQSFSNYDKGGFDWTDQERLAQWLANQPCPVVTSNLATERIVELYSDLGFELHYVQGPRLIACTGDRKPVRELLAVKLT